jgi:hypothetical protein
MKRILIRSGKSPFRVATPAEFIQQDLIGTNSGNLLFSNAAHKLLLTRDTQITSNGIRTDCSPERAGQINEEYDVFVVPLANAFRPTFHESLDKLSQLIEQLTIPVVVLGVGAQATSDYDTDELQPMADSVRRFAAAVLDRSATIGVRGELTADYLGALGIRDVDIIGCPSMFLYGSDFPVPREPGPFDADSRIAINLSPNAIPVGDIAAVARYAHELFPHLAYYAQNLLDAELLYWGDTSRVSGYDDPFPLQLSHVLLRENKVRVPLDPSTWIDELRAYDFAYGTRIHGNVAALLAGTPSVVLAHDSRTLELCRYFDIPYRMLDELPPDVHPAELYEKADYSAMLSGHRERFDRLIAFLDKHSLENTYSHGDGGAAFEAQLAGLNLPPSMEVWDGADDGSLQYRFARLREQILRTRTRVDNVVRVNKELRQQLAAARKQLNTTQGQLTTMQRQLTAMQERVSGIERRVAVRLGPAIRRRVRRVGQSGG